MTPDKPSAGSQPKPETSSSSSDWARVALAAPRFGSRACPRLRDSDRKVPFVTVGVNLSVPSRVSDWAEPTPAGATRVQPAKSPCWPVWTDYESTHEAFGLVVRREHGGDSGGLRFE